MGHYWWSDVHLHYV